MKTNTLLFIASLAVLTTGASAASSQNESDIVVLPTYTVSTPRYLPVEREINASLKEFSQQAGAAQAIAPELAVLKQAAAQNPLAKVSRTPAVVHVAKS